MVWEVAFNERPSHPPFIHPSIHPPLRNSESMRALLDGSTTFCYCIGVKPMHFTCPLHRDKRRSDTMAVQSYPIPTNRGFHIDRALFLCPECPFETRFRKLALFHQCICHVCHTHYDHLMLYRRKPYRRNPRRISWFPFLLSLRVWSSSRSRNLPLSKDSSIRCSLWGEANPSEILPFHDSRFRTLICFQNLLQFCTNLNLLF